MNNILLTLLICLIAAAQAFTQTSKGSKAIGGNIAFSKSKTNINGNIINQDQVEKRINITFSPAFSYFIIDNLSLGITFPFSYEEKKIEHEITGSTTYKEKTIFGGPIVRYYIPFNSLAIFPFGSIAYGYQNSGIPEIHPYFRASAFITRGTIFSYDIGIGTAYFIHDTISVEALLFYHNQKLINDDFEFAEKKENAINFNVGLQFYFCKAVNASRL